MKHKIVKMLHAHAKDARHSEVGSSVVRALALVAR